MTITETFWNVGNHYRILNNLFLQFKYTCHFDPALKKNLFALYLLSWKSSILRYHLLYYLTLKSKNWVYEFQGFL